MPLYDTKHPDARRIIVRDLDGERIPLVFACHTEEGWLEKAGTDDRGYVLKEQKTDGSWHIARSKIFMPFKVGLLQDDGSETPLP